VGVPKLDVKEPLRSLPLSIGANEVKLVSMVELNSNVRYADDFSLLSSDSELDLPIDCVAMVLFSAEVIIALMTSLSVLKAKLLILLLKYDAFEAPEDSSPVGLGASTVLVCRSDVDEMSYSRALIDEEKIEPQP
jgi:hypothetical protein